LERALDSNCKVINGEEMLLAQAQAQFQLFTGSDYIFPQNFVFEIFRG
jgi:shikimate 5-dehydrogenase